MRYLLTYDFMESLRVTNQWMGSSARAMCSYPQLGLFANPMIQMTAAWGEVTERTFARMVAKPDWGIYSIPADDGRDHTVSIETVVPRPFGDLIRFKVQGRAPTGRKVLLVAPMSGHYATLLRSTVLSLLPDCDVYITDWHNARDIPVSEGKFDIEDYPLPRRFPARDGAGHPCDRGLSARAPGAGRHGLPGRGRPRAQPRTLTLIGGPIDPDAAATDVTDFGRRVTMGQLERYVLQRVGFKYAGAGRMVYPGLQQLSSFMAMNAEKHAKAFSEQSCVWPRARRRTTTSTTSSTTSTSP
jgi:poly(3-hydroxybutyrate) depolymerase